MSDQWMIEQFKAAINNAQPRPKGVGLSTALAKALFAAGLIKKRQANVLGFFGPGFELPYFEDIFVFGDPTIDDTGRLFELPPASK